jgi:hypothetical protein
MRFDDWWRLIRTDLQRELDDHGLAVQEVARKAWAAAVDEAAVIAFDMPLESQEERHAYRWKDTAKAMAWDIAHAIRKRLDSQQPQSCAAKEE